MSDKQGKSRQDADSNAQFVYKQLDLGKKQVRLIQVLPGGPHPVLQCRMRVAHPREEHIALSYVWGEDKPSHVIEVNGQMFLVRSNLFSFLHYARKYLSHQWLWIDAICIDQGNIGERNHQVRQMTRIYANANYVVIWFGEKYDLSRHLLDMVRSISMENSKGSTLHLSLRQIRRSGPAISQLFEASYWERLWIVPEVLSARRLKIACIKGSIAWEQFMVFVRAIWMGEYPSYAVSKDLLTKIADSRLVAFLNIWRNRNKEGYSLKTLLQAYAVNKCADPRDKVFVLSALSTESQTLRIDYSMNKTELFDHVISTARTDDMEKLELAQTLVEALQLGIADYSRNELKDLLDFLASRGGRSKDLFYKAVDMIPENAFFNDRALKICHVERQIISRELCGQLVRRIRAGRLTNHRSTEIMQSVLEYWRSLELFSWKMLATVVGTSLSELLGRTIDGYYYSILSPIMQRSFPSDWYTYFSYSDNMDGLMIGESYRTMFLFATEMLWCNTSPGIKNGKHSLPYASRHCISRRDFKKVFRGFANAYARLRVVIKASRNAIGITHGIES